MMMNDAADIEIIYQNVRGLRTKISDLYLQSFTMECEILALSETWLKEGIFDTELLNSTFVVYRKDRNYAQTGVTRGGGVLLALKTSFQAVRIVLQGLNDLDCDYVGVRVRRQDLAGSLHVFVFYFPPNTAAETYARVCDALTIYMS